MSIKFKTLLTTCFYCPLVFDKQCIDSDNIKGRSYDRDKIKGRSYDGDKIKGRSYDGDNIKGRSYDGDNVWNMIAVMTGIC